MVSKNQMNRILLNLLNFTYIEVNNRLTNIKFLFLHFNFTEDTYIL